MFLIGFLFGLGLQFNYSFVLAIVAGVIWLIATRKISQLTLFSILLGFVVGFSPIIFFELRNHFYNTQTFLLAMRNISHSQSGGLNWFYFLSLVPLGLLFVSWVISKIHKLNQFIAYTLVILYIVWSTITLIFTSPNVLNFPALLQISQTIRQDNPSQFNIVDQLSKDNRALALRYLLTVQGEKPLDYMQYPKSKTLFVYSNLPLNNLLTHSVWEISSAQPMHLSKYWIIQHGIKVYKLQK